MSYSNVRLITKTESIDVLNQLLEKQNGKTIADIIKEADINKTYNDIVYLGWERLSSGYVLLLSDAMIELEDQELSYRLTTIGEATEEIEELHYTSEKDEEKDIPYPSIIRSFDEIDMELQLKCYDDYINRLNERDTIEYE